MPSGRDARKTPAVPESQVLRSSLFLTAKNAKADSRFEIHLSCFPRKARKLVFAIAKVSVLRKPQFKACCFELIQQPCFMFISNVCHGKHSQAYGLALKVHPLCLERNAPYGKLLFQTLLMHCLK